MNKVAKLVAVSIMTRVIVDKNATDEEIMKVAKPQLVRNLNKDGIFDHIESIEDDEEIPFGKGRLDVYFQPDFEHPLVKKLNQKGCLSSYDVFADKAEAQRAFPDVKIIEYSGDDIEDPNLISEGYIKKLDKLIVGNK